MSDDKYKNYIYDLSTLFKEKAKKAKRNKDSSIGTDNANYDLGYLMAFHEMIDVMQQQAKAFNIEKGDIGLGDINADSDLL